MVSTRGVKSKFIEGEKVLCYEPDPTKARVLYDSKVLEVLINKDHKGRKNIEYLIHFQGWNSSWDRCVREEFVLKDTPENRQLQKELAQKSRLQIGTYLYRRESKKHIRKTSERTNVSSEDGSCGSPALMEDEDCPRNNSSSSEEESSIDDDLVHIELTRDLRERLEQDHHFINEKHKLHKLPADPNVVTILESYWKQYVSNQICCLSEKPTKYRSYSSYPKIRLEDVQRNVNICKEVLDGIRIYFDFTLNDLLLYKSEQGQIEIAQAKSLPLKSILKDGNHSSPDSEEYSHSPMTEMDELYNNETNQNSHNLLKSKTRRRKLRSNRNFEANLNGNHVDNCDVKPIIGNNSHSNDINSTNRVPSWKALPDHVYSQNPRPPCLVYGATHLTRLFVKLPELLNNTNMPDDKLKVLLNNLNLFIDYLNDHKEWYGERFYVADEKKVLE